MRAWSVSEVMAPSNRPNMKVLDRLELAETACLAAAGSIAALVLGAWLVPAAGSVFPDGWSLMKANTALSVLLCTAHLVLTRRRPNPLLLLASQIGVGVVIFLAGTALAGHLSGYTFGVDTLLAADGESPIPGRMSLQTALFFLLLGITLLLERLLPSLATLVLDVLTLVLCVTVLVIFSGYLFQAASLYGQSPSVRTSQQTLACMAVLAFVVAVRRTRSGFFSLFVGVGIGSRMLRRALPFVLLLPLLLNSGATWLAAAGWLSTPYAVALSAVLAAASLFLLVMLLARKINDLERDLRDMSLTDELTQIFNRRAFFLLGEQALLRARRTRRPLTLLYFDLDGLKKVNDTMGHDAGSQLLARFARLLQETFRSTDIVARVGGDEFVVACVGTQSEVTAAVQRLDAATEEANADGRPYRISYSLGEAISKPDEEDSIAALMDQADAQMYQRKLRKKLAAG